MAKKAEERYCGMHGGKGALMLGLLLLVVGLLFEYGYSLPRILMIVGALMLLKGIILKAKYK